MKSHSNLIGSKISEMRKKMGLSQSDLAKKVSISPQAVGKWERGESLPDINTLSKLAEIFDIDLALFTTSSHDEELPEPLHQPTPSSSAQDHKPVSRNRFDWNWDMSKGNWADADFSGLKDLKDQFSSSNISNCQFKKSDLSNIVLAKNNIDKCDFSESDLRDAKIQSSNVMASIFHRSSMIDAQIYKSNIEKCNFSDADFSGTEIIETNFENTIVENTIWKFTKFQKSNLSNMTFTGILENCHFENCGFYNVKFENATITNSFFKHNDRFKKVVFINCTVDSITYAFLKNNQANLEGITINDK